MTLSWVDNLWLFGSQEDVAAIEADLQDAFEYKCKGEVTVFVGNKIDVGLYDCASCGCYHSICMQNV